MSVCVCCVQLCIVSYKHYRVCFAGVCLCSRSSTPSLQLCSIEYGISIVSFRARMSWALKCFCFCVKYVSSLFGCVLFNVCSLTVASHTVRLIRNKSFISTCFDFLSAVVCISVTNCHELRSGRSRRWLHNYNLRMLSSSLSRYNTPSVSVCICEMPKMSRSLHGFNVFRCIDLEWKANNSAAFGVGVTPNLVLPASHAPPLRPLACFDECVCTTTQSKAQQ